MRDKTCNLYTLFISPCPPFQHFLKKILYFSSEVVSRKRMQLHRRWDVFICAYQTAVHVVQLWQVGHFWTNRAYSVKLALKTTSLCVKRHSNRGTENTFSLLGFLDADSQVTYIQIQRRVLLTFPRNALIPFIQRLTTFWLIGSAANLAALQHL